MSSPNPLSTTPPFAVEKSLRRIGADLRYARLRRNLRIEDVAAKIGTGPRAIRDAENGKPTTGMVVYTALLWAYDLINQLDEVAQPVRDAEGQMLSRLDERLRARRSPAEELDNDF